jgi:hypothetical protein
MVLTKESPDHERALSVTANIAKRDIMVFRYWYIVLVSMWLYGR